MSQSESVAVQREILAVAYTKDLVIPTTRTPQCFRLPTAPKDDPVVKQIVDDTVKEFGFQEDYDLMERTTDVLSVPTCTGVLIKHLETTSDKNNLTYEEEFDILIMHLIQAPELQSDDGVVPFLYDALHPHLDKLLELKSSSQSAGIMPDGVTRSKREAVSITVCNLLDSVNNGLPLVPALPVIKQESKKVMGSDGGKKNHRIIMVESHMSQMFWQAILGPFMNMPRQLTTGVGIGTSIFGIFSTILMTSFGVTPENYDTTFLRVDDFTNFDVSVDHQLKLLFLLYALSFVTPNSLAMWGKVVPGMIAQYLYPIIQISENEAIKVNSISSGHLLTSIGGSYIQRFIRASFTVHQFRQGVLDPGLYDVLGKVYGDDFIGKDGPFGDEALDFIRKKFPHVDIKAELVPVCEASFLKRFFVIEHNEKGEPYFTTKRLPKHVVGKLKRPNGFTADEVLKQCRSLAEEANNDELYDLLMAIYDRVAAKYGVKTVVLDALFDNYTALPVNTKVTKSMVKARHAPSVAAWNKYVVNQKRIYKYGL